MKQTKLLPIKLIFPFFLMIISLSSFGQFTLQKLKINAPNLRILVARNFTHLYGQFSTTNGTKYLLFIYGKTGNREVPEDVTGFFLDDGQSTNFSFPCIFGNIEWKVDFPPRIQSGTIYLLQPENPADNDNNIYYSWSTSGATPAIERMSGIFNPVPPRRADVSFDALRARTEAEVLKKQ